MESIRSHSIFRTRSFPFIFVVALLPLAAAVVWFYLMSFKSIELVLEQQTGRLAHRYASAATQVYSRLLDETAVLTRGREIGRFYSALQKRDRNEAIRLEGEELKAYLNWWNVELSADLYRQVIYLDGQGNPVYKYVFQGDNSSVGNEAISLDLGLNTMVFTLEDRLGVPNDNKIQLSSFSSGNETIFRFVRPLRPLRGKKESPGYLAVDISMVSILGEQQDDDMSLLIHSRTNHKILFSSQGQEVLNSAMSLGELMPGLGLALKEQGGADEEVVFTYRENGEEFLASRVDIEEPLWTVTVFTPMDSYMAPTKITGNYTLAITACFMIFSIWIVSKLSRRVQERSHLLEQANSDLQEANKVVNEHNLLLEKELDTAHTMQMELMPTVHPEILGFDIAGVCRPATHVGGDFFQYFPLPDGRLVLAMADVTGHGMEAAIPTVLFSGILDNQMEYDNSPDALFSRLNRSLYRTLNRRTFVCFTMGELDPVAKRIRLTNGGCPYPYHYSASTGQVEELCLDAFPLGLRPEADYSVVEVALAPGDRIVFCSDGIIEAEQGETEIFGFERTAEIIGEAARDNVSAVMLTERLLEAVDRFTGVSEQHDDQTIVVLGVEG